MDRGCLLRGGREVRLRAKTFLVLRYLHEHHGRLVTKDDLFRAVWPDTFVSDDSLTKCVREIRTALGDRDHQLLKTVARRGFILDAPLATAPPSSQDHESPERRMHNLPASISSLIGRRREIAELARLLPAVRLLTLTGAGGCGKTRLALELARGVRDEFADGAWLADLAPLRDAALVAQTVASVLDVRQSTGRTLVTSLADWLRHRRTLLLLDNCEHVLASTAGLAESLLCAAEGLTILATSREPLGIPGETTWRVPSLTLPEGHHAGSVNDLLSYEAVHLLAERSAAVNSGFAVTTDNASTVADVCRRLDGIPLAIELAAARLKVLSIEQINSRLDDRFRLLTRTDSTRIGRQRTLEAAVDWSYDLLLEPERQLLRRLSAFGGGWTIDAAEHVCAGAGIDPKDVLDLTTRLVDKSLVMVDGEFDSTRRYRFLETVRQYARERLQQSGEEESVRGRLFEFFLNLAHAAEPELLKRNQLLWLERLQREHDNLRIALEWGLASDQAGRRSLELATALHWFWLKRGYLDEGVQFLERALAKHPGAATNERARGLMALGTLIFFRGDFPRAQNLLDDCAALARAGGELSTEAFALGIGAMAAMERQDPVGGARRAEESAVAARAAGMPWLEGFSLTFHAYEALFAGAIDRAADLHENAVALGRTHGDVWGLGIVLNDLAILRVVQHRHGEARALCGEAIALGRQCGDRRAIAWALGVIAGADAAEGHPARAARLRGAMNGLLQSIGSSVQPSYNTLIGERLFEAVQLELGAEGYRQALEAGQAMPFAQAIDYALEGLEQR
jgi:non-specific serine/threonine protein kinase